MPNCRPGIESTITELKLNHSPNVVKATDKTITLLRSKSSYNGRLTDRESLTCHYYKWFPAYAAALAYLIEREAKRLQVAKGEVSSIEGKLEKLKRMTAS